MQTTKQMGPRVIIGVLIYDEEGKIFLAKSNKWKNKWVVPAGHLEWGETMHECAKREIKEETNIDIEKLELISVSENIFPHEYKEAKHMVFIDFSAKALHKNIKLNCELQEHDWFYPKDALKLDIHPSTTLFVEDFIQKVAN